MINRFVLAFLAFSNFGFGQNIVDFRGHDYEHIVSYHSDIFVQKDCSVKVIETIEVLVIGYNINHGIFRELPLSYAYRGGNVNVGFELVSIKYDGAIEDYHTENFSNGIRIYAGSASRYVSQGMHTYQIEYIVDHVLGVYDEFDELSWNVNGNGWDFYLDSISANVYLPEGARIKQFYGYTGVFGSAGQDYVAKEIEGGVQFVGSRSFGYNENMTVAVAWEKGVMVYPTAWEEFIYFLKSYILWIIAILGILIVFISNFITWYRYGRDPKPGTIIPLFYAPEGFSPAECVYLKKGGKPSAEMFGSMLVSLAIKGMISIQQTNSKSKIYNINKLKDDNSDEANRLNDIELKFFKRIFSANDLLIIKENNYNSIVKIAKEELEKDVDAKQNNLYYFRNKQLATRQFILPFIFAVIGGLAYAFMGGSIAIIVIAFILTIIMNIIYIRLYEQPTKEGRKKMDEIAGFEMYMKYADQNRIKAMNPPTLNFEHFEENLAYAIALGVAKEWTGKFDIPELKEDVNGQYHSRMPYLMGMSMASIGNVGNEISHTISSASTPPSSSGSSGGGFSGGGGYSGGGGGGGGGGGW